MEKKKKKDCKITLRIQFDISKGELVDYLYTVLGCDQKEAVLYTNKVTDKMDTYLHYHMPMKCEIDKIIYFLEKLKEVTG